ncbi:MAG: sulfatase-like hydrolase/transferase [Oscillospiraceae bacterium]|nr:sulfatase-like hydrolase/transferase [Oscillospiraceae bacterium]
MSKKAKKKKNTAAWKKTAAMTPSQKRSYHAALRKIKKQDQKEAARKAAEAAAAEKTHADSATPAKKPGLRSLLLYWLVFFAAIVYWEVYLGILAQGSVLSLNWWFLLFALPVSLIPAALCGWWRDRADRIIAAVLMLALFAFYVSQFIYFRVFGSMISMSMIGVGGDALANFGWAMMVTIRESIHLLILFALPVLMMIVWIFVRRPAAPSYRMWLRPAALLCVVPLWLLAGAALRIGGTGEPSAYNAYHSALTDTDTASRKIGVLTTSVMELRSTSSADKYDAEIADTFNTASGNDMDISLGAAAPVLLPEPENISQIKAGAESVEEPLQPEEIAPELLKPMQNRLDGIDFEYLASVAEDEAVKTLCEYYSGVSATNRNDYTGLLEDYNLICVCAESFCSYAISETLTPTLYKLSHEGIVLTNFYNSYKNTTTNGEFSFMTGLWPDVSRKADKGVTDGSFGQSVKHYMPYGLGHMFEEIGVNSYAFHNYYGEYYGRAKTHKNLGFKCKFMGEMKFSNKWPSSDLEMMKQSVDDYINEDRFNVYYMTFSGHGPYDKDKNATTKHNLSKVPKTLDGRELNYGARCYLANNLELEYAMKYLMDRLDEAGKLDNTLIVLVGDHYPYYLTDKAAKSLLGYLPDTEFERYRSTCMMWFNGLAEPIVCDTPCCNVDILPTILNLMNIEYDSRLISGTDIFSDSLHAAMLYNKNFITDKVKYNAADGKAEWLVDTEGISEEDLQAYVDNVYSILKGRYAAALSINNLDFYRFVWDNLLVPESEPETAEAVPIEAADEDINAGPMIYMTEETMPFYTTRAGRE